MPGDTEETLEAIGHMEPEAQSQRASGDLSGERQGGLRLQPVLVTHGGPPPGAAASPVTLHGGKESLWIFGIKNWQTEKRFLLHTFFLFTAIRKTISPKQFFLEISQIF